jgi:endonuclease YncB( thermonuclease family)
MAGALAFLLALPVWAADCAAPQNAGPVAAVTDGRTFILASGRTVRLAMLEAPAVTEDTTQDPQGGAGARASRAALATLIADSDVALSLLGEDRFGRSLARAYVSRGGTPRAVDTELVAAGNAFVSPYAGNQNCAPDVIAAERAARGRKLGLWGDPYYAMRSADDPDAVLAARGRFAIVEGKVVSVRESGATIYVNFGRQWSEDFTVTTLKRNGRLFSASGMEPRSLAGRKVRVRGVIEERGGPWIEAVAPAQIEIADR